MSVDVVFRGVMLFCSTGQGAHRELRDVLLPDCEDRIPLHGAKHGDELYHLDGTRAVQHYAGILVAPKDDQPRYYALRGVDVTIGNDDGHPRIGNKIESFAKTGDIKGNAQLLQVNLQARRASKITLGAGPTDDDDIKSKPPRHKFKFGANHDVHNVLTLTYPNGLKVKIASSEIDVPDDSKIYIYNFDEREPSIEQLEVEHETSKAFIIDHDFKWIYSLLKPMTGKKLDVWTGGYLPAPSWVGDGRAITVSTCFPGWIELGGAKAVRRGGSRKRRPAKRRQVRGL